MEQVLRVQFSRQVMHGEGGAQALKAWVFGRQWNVSDPEKMEGAVARKEWKLTFPETSELEH